MTRAYTHHLRMTHRDTQEMWNRECHEDALPEMQVVPFDHAPPLKVIRSIDRAEILLSAFIFVSAFVGIGLSFAIGN